METKRMTYNEKWNAYNRMRGIETSSPLRESLHILLTFIVKCAGAVVALYFLHELLLTHGGDLEATVNGIIGKISDVKNAVIVFGHLDTNTTQIEPTGDICGAATAHDLQEIGENTRTVQYGTCPNAK